MSGPLNQFARGEADITLPMKRGEPAAPGPLMID